MSNSLVHSAAITVAVIDAELPQTQCGKCGYDGCRPYAKAIVEADEAINRCPPGGDSVRDRLAEITHKPALRLIEPEQQPLLAVIREAECIGCTKCIQACPVDAIMGAAKQMHSVITSECTGCELCVAPCPVDCIDLITHPEWANATSVTDQQHYKAARAINGRQRFEARKQRLEQALKTKQAKRDSRRAQAISEPCADTPIDLTALKASRATLTARLKRSQKALSKATDNERNELTARVESIQQELNKIEQMLNQAPRDIAQQSSSSHIAIAAAEQAVLQAERHFEHLKRQGKPEDLIQARVQIDQARELLAKTRSH